MVRFAGYARKREPKWPYTAIALIILLVVAMVIFIFSLTTQWLDQEINKPITTTTTTTTTTSTSTTVPTTTIPRSTTTTSLVSEQTEDISVPVAESAAEIKVDRIAITSGVDESNLPVDDLSRISVNEFSKIYCYTKILNDGDPQPVRHVWVSPSGKTVAEIELTAHNGISNTWSYKHLLGLMTGQWEVRVETKDGTVLAKKDFETY